jgi:putative flippase GtrA
MRMSRPGPAAARRFVRYASVSAISTVTTLLVLGVLVGLAGFPAIWSNLVATALGTVPSFELNRRWVWSQGGPRSLGRQALPYCTLSFAGLVLSTLAVHFAADATASSTPLVHTAAVELANFGSYGLLWALQFLLCDRVLFRAGRPGAPARARPIPLGLSPAEIAQAGNAPVPSKGSALSGEQCGNRNFEAGPAPSQTKIPIPAN